VKGTFVRCTGCGKTLAWGNPAHWQKSFPHSEPGCKGVIEVIVQATGCRTRGELGDQFALVEAWGRDADYVMMDLEDWEAVKGKWTGDEVWGARVILNGYIIPRDEVGV